MSKTLEYYFYDGSYISFDNYKINTTGIISNNISGKVLTTQKSGKYNTCSVYDTDGKKRDIRICRAIASTFIGIPLSPKHTADHIDRDTDNDTLDNIRWLCKTGQTSNRVMPEKYKSAFIIANNGLEKTGKEWIKYLKKDKNPFGREYTVKMILHYAERKQFGFSYKEYSNLPGEVWKSIVVPDKKKTSWEISNMNRVKYVTKKTAHVMSGKSISLSDAGYPTIRIGCKQWGCHILSFMAFFPEEYALKRQIENVLHENDDKLDFRPHNLRLGTQSDNTKDAHDNGKYDGKKSARMRCASYINGVFEKEYDSQKDAAIYLKSKGFDKVSRGEIGRALESYRCGKISTRYERTWEVCTA